MKQTITKQNKHLLEEQFRNLSVDEFNEFVHDDNKGNAQSTMGIVHQSIDENSKKIFMDVAKREYQNRGYALLDKMDDFFKEENTQNDLNEDIIELDEVELDTTTALLESVKNSNINSTSFFAKSKMLDDISETIDISRQDIENYLDTKIINENVVYENAIYTKIQDALNTIKPVTKPQIKMDMSESQIWLEIKANEDWLLESKIKTYLTAKKNEYQKLSVVEKSIKQEVHADPIHELNKLQVSIQEENKKYNAKEIKLVSIAMDEGLEKFNLLKEQYDISAPKDSSLLSRFIRANEILESQKVVDLLEKTKEYLEKMAKGTNKDIQYKPFFDYKSIIKNDKESSAVQNVPPQLDWIGEYSIILKETDKSFYFNIVTEVFTQEKIKDSKALVAELEENYTTDLLKSKKTLEKKYKGKKFTASPIDDTDSITHVDTNGWRIHLYQDPKTEKSIEFNIEYYPSDYKKSDLTETETFYKTISESRTAKQLEQYLLNGEHIMIPDTGVVLWYSLSKKKFMIDMKPSTWDKLYAFYKQESKRHHGEI